jgi:hypothetical protein
MENAYGQNRLGGKKRSQKGARNHEPNPPGPQGNPRELIYYNYAGYGLHFCGGRRLAPESCCARAFSRCSAVLLHHWTPPVSCFRAPEGVSLCACCRHSNCTRITHPHSPSCYFPCMQGMRHLWQPQTITDGRGKCDARVHVCYAPRARTRALQRAQHTQLRTHVPPTHEPSPHPLPGPPQERQGGDLLVCPHGHSDMAHTSHAAGS